VHEVNARAYHVAVLIAKRRINISLRLYKYPR